jgi:hypothetical protein
MRFGNKRQFAAVQKANYCFGGSSEPFSMDLWRQGIEGAPDVRRSSAPFFCDRATAWTKARGPRGSITDDLGLSGATTPLRDPNGASAPLSATALGFSQICAPGKRCSRDSTGETPAIDFGELPVTLGRLGRALDARPRAENSADVDGSSE